MDFPMKQQTTMGIKKTFHEKIATTTKISWNGTANVLWQTDRSKKRTADADL